MTNKSHSRRSTSTRLLLHRLITTCCTLFLLLLPSSCRATITLSTTGKQLHSRPAAFGLNFEYDLQYVALLQYVQDDMHLCHGVTEIHPGNSNDGRVERVIPVPATNGDSNSDSNADDSNKNGTSSDPDSNNNNNNTNDNMIHITPSTNGIPVALLAKRGQCTYETKAKVASTLTTPEGVVRFLIVYDDEMEDGEHLITMMPRRESGSDGSGEDEERERELYDELGLVFVSYESGMALHEYLNTQTLSTKQQGGPQILIDGTDGWFPPYDDSAASFAFLLMIFGCFCSYSVFLSSSNLAGGRGGMTNSDVMNEHQLFLLGGDTEVMNGTGRNTRTSRRRGNGLRLLTMEEVETLPTIEYASCSSSASDVGNGSEDDGQSGVGGESSRELELRDKTDMPYLNDDHEEDVEGLGVPRDDGHAPLTREEDDDDDDELKGGGLCQAVKSSKKDDLLYRHASCSICLDEYQMGEQIRVLPCQHTFHSECIFPWLTERSPTCPLCKAMFEAVHVEEEDEQQQEDNIEDDQSQRTEASAGDEGATGDLEGTHNNEGSGEAPRQRTSSRIWRNLFGSSGTGSRSNDAGANAINNEGNTLEEPLLPDV